MLENILIIIFILVGLTYVFKIIIDLFNYDEETERIFKEYLNEEEQQCNDNYIGDFEIIKDRD